MFGTERLVEVRRGGRVESEHRGAIAVVEATGRLMAHVGDVELVSYLRSSAKPFQLLPLIESGGADRFGFTDRELAVMAASHSGEPRHVETVRSILNKISLTESALQCGVHPPLNVEAAKALRAAGQTPTAIHNNCSGKHAGMLAQAVDRGLSTHDYVDPKHPIQITIRQVVAELSGVAFDDIGLGVDGCSVPCFALSLRSAAMAFAKLAEARGKGQGAWIKALARVAQVMMDNPEMIGGEGRLDTDLMRVAKGRVVSKGGAEGYQGVGILSQAGSPAMGIAIKTADGDGKRGGHPVVIETLRQLGVLDEEQLAALHHHHTWTVMNHRGIEVGEVRASFRLIRDV
jgi:L-asparaginase II